MVRKTIKSTKFGSPLEKDVTVKTEDVAWFLEVKSIMGKLGTGEFSKNAKPEPLETSKSVQAIMKKARKAYTKFKRIEDILQLTQEKG